MNEQGWIIPGAFADNRITLFQWSNQLPTCDSIKANREKIRDGYIYIILEGPRMGDKIIVEKGIITRYEETKRSNQAGLEVVLV